MTLKGDNIKIKKKELNLKKIIGNNINKRLKKL